MVDFQKAVCKTTGSACYALAPLPKQLVCHCVSTRSSQSGRVLYQTCSQNWFDTSKIMDGGYIKQSVGCRQRSLSFPVENSTSREIQFELHCSTKESMTYRGWSFYMYISTQFRSVVWAGTVQLGIKLDVFCLRGSKKKPKCYLELIPKGKSST